MKCFLNKSLGFKANRPDSRYPQTVTVTIYSIEKLCQGWVQHASLESVKSHMSRLQENMDVNDFLLGPKKSSAKRFAYAMYNKVWKVSQMETA